MICITNTAILVTRVKITEKTKMPLNHLSSLSIWRMYSFWWHKLFDNRGKKSFECYKCNFCTESTCV